MDANTIHIEQSSSNKNCYWLREENAIHPYGYIERVGDKWWAAIPYGGVCGYFPTRNKALAAIV